VESGQAIYGILWTIAVFFFTCEFSPNFDLQNIILTYTKGISHAKNGPNSPDFFFIKKINLPKLYNKFQSIFLL
jgi:hypothetical protein